MAGARRDAGLRFQEADEVDAQPVRHVHPAVMVGDELHALEGRRFLLPLLDGRIPACLEVRVALLVLRGIGRVQGLHALRQLARRGPDGARVGLEMRVAVGMDVAHGAVHAGSAPAAAGCHGKRPGSPAGRAAPCRWRPGAAAPAASPPPGPRRCIPRGRVAPHARDQAGPRLDEVRVVVGAGGADDVRVRCRRSRSPAPPSGVRRRIR